ncbi:MAG: RNA polymerase sigma factor [Candidatus Shapirobacteria bacterium]
MVCAARNGQVVTDEEVVQKVQGGEKEGYVKVVERYQKKLFWYLQRLINQPNEEVEDVLQDVFINAYTNLKGFDTRRKFSSWVYRIAHNKAVDYMKKKKLKTTTIEDKEEFFETNEKLFEELAIERERAREVKKTIECLEVKYREVIVLYFYDEKSYEDISEILHVPTGHVGVLLKRAKEKLKKLMSKNYYY